MTDSWTERLDAGRDVSYWKAHTQLLMRDAQTLSGRQLQHTLRNFAYWSEVSAARPDAIDPDLFAVFVEGFSRIAGNYGTVEGVNIIAAIDGVIELQRQSGQPTTRLWLAKARHLQKISLEERDREKALNAALNDSQIGSELWAEALVAYTWYLIDISRYDSALRLLTQLQRHLPGALFERKYRCAALTMSGIALFSSFKDHRGAAQRLQEARAYEQVASNDGEIRRWLASVYHYLGRLAEVDRKYPQALLFYIHGQHLQQQCPEELPELGFIHLRISEPLIAMSNFDAARDHLNAAAVLFAEAVEHSSGRLQADLGFAALSAAQGDIPAALTIVQRSRADARQIGFWRGELLCLGYQLSLHLRMRRPRLIFRTTVDIARTIRGGELGRNNLIRLISKIPTLVGVAIRRMSHHAKTSSADKTTTRCPCPTHSQTGTAR